MLVATPVPELHSHSPGPSLVPPTLHSTCVVVLYRGFVFFKVASLHVLYYSWHINSHDSYRKPNSEPTVADGLLLGLPR